MEDLQALNLERVDEWPNSTMNCWVCHWWKTNKRSHNYRYRSLIKRTLMKTTSYFGQIISIAGLSSIGTSKRRCFIRVTFTQRWIDLIQLHAHTIGELSSLASAIIMSRVSQLKKNNRWYYVIFNSAAYHYLEHDDSRIRNVLVAELMNKFVRRNVLLSNSMIGNKVDHDALQIWYYSWTDWFHIVNDSVYWRQRRIHDSSWMATRLVLQIGCW